MELNQKITELSQRATLYFCKKYNLGDEVCVVICSTWVGGDLPNEIHGAQAWFAAFNRKGLIHTDWNDQLINRLEEAHDLDMCLDMLTEQLDSLEFGDQYKLNDGARIVELTGYGD